MFGVACPRPRGHDPGAEAFHAHADVGMPPFVGHRRIAIAARIRHEPFMRSAL
jgi:hypothetical protein